MGSKLASPRNVITVPALMLPRSGPALATGAPLGGGGPDTLLVSVQAFNDKAASNVKRPVHTMFCLEG